MVGSQQSAQLHLFSVLVRTSAPSTELAAQPGVASLRSKQLTRSCIGAVCPGCIEPICRSALSLPATWMPLLAFDRCMGVRLLAQVAFKNAKQ
jgi:hypothetical protein